MRIRRVAVAVVLTGLGFVVACTLNPQPLPPAADSKIDSGSPDGGRGFGTSTDAAAPTTTQDAASEFDDEAGTDAGDAGDAEVDAATDGGGDS
jgi:hypothetical protein